MSTKSVWASATNADGDLRLRVPLKMPAWLAVQCLLFVLLGLCAGGAIISVHAQSVVINEFLASNINVPSDEDGDSEDWIELYNPSSNPINLEGYSLTDDPEDLNKWVFPEVWLQAQGFLVIWASGKDRRPPVCCDFGYPLIVELESAGLNDGNVARIVVNGKDRSLNLRGLNIVRLDAQGEYVESTAYDTYGATDAADSMVRYLERLTSGEILIISIKDEASAQLTSKARAALEALGSEDIGQLDYQDSWGMICLVGQGKLVEDYHVTTKGPAAGFLASTMTLHTNFKINKDGEYLGLYSPAGTLIDSVSFDRQLSGVSFGRQWDGSDYWSLFSKPTPLAPNHTQCASEIAEPPQSSMSSGFYNGPITVTLTAPGALEIHYTLDGSTPTKASQRFIDTLIIEETQVLRARAFKNGLIPSTPATYIYLIDEDIHLPVLSLVTDPANLWDNEIGIYTNYVQRGRKWEREASVELFQRDGPLEFKLNAGIRIYGGYTRKSSKKSFRIYFREVYGEDHLNCRIFTGDEPDKPELQTFKSLVVRNAGNDGYDSHTRIRDPLMHTLLAEEGGLVSAKRSVFVYLNGEPWGIYNLREHIDKDYLDSNFGVEDVDLLMEDDQVVTGDASHWASTFSFLEEHDLSADGNFQHANTLIDIKNFTDYQLFQIYGANLDLVGNMCRFRPRSPGGNWQWIMWDADLAFGLEGYTTVSHNTLAWAIRDTLRPDLGPPWTDGAGSLEFTLVLRKLLENDEYRTYFINRIADLLNTTLHPSNAVAKIDSLASTIEPDIPLEMACWSDALGGTLEEWLANVHGLRDFAQQRPKHVQQHILEEFELRGIASLTIEPPSGEGSIQVNTVLPTSYPWHGTYFQEVPVTLKAQPAQGYDFAGWSDPSLPHTATVAIKLPEHYSVQARFTPSDQEADISINFVDISPASFKQGDKFKITINFDVARDLNNLTVAYVVEDEDGSDLAYLESDFFDVKANGGQDKIVEFKWTDFNSAKVGALTLSTGFIKQYSADMRSSTIKAAQTINRQFVVEKVNDQVLKCFISRENSLWWLTEMGWVDSPMARNHDLDYGVMYGGFVTGELTNEEYYADGSNVLCYWEISGYAVRALALEYERTGNTKYKDLAKRIADTIIKNLNDGSVHPENNGTIHTFDFYNGTEGGFEDQYRDIAVIFDHAQIQMGLLELGRVMEKKGDRGYEIYQNEGKRVGDFLYFVYENNSNVLPDQWFRDSLASSETSQDTKAVIGMKYLYENTNDTRYRDMARSELDRLCSFSPTPGSDYHGQSYFAYGMIKGFEWFGDESYLEKAEEYAAGVSFDLDSNGKLVNEEYSRIPAQSQIVRNNTLLWKYTGNDVVLRWADESASYLTNTDDVWVYNQPVLKLGKYYRESGGQYNYAEEPQLTSWGTEFYIDAFYHYLHHRYGDIYVDMTTQKVISMISDPIVTFGEDEIHVAVNSGVDGVGVYINSPRNIRAVFLDDEPTYYFTDHTARTPVYEGSKTMKIVFGEPTTPHIIRTNSIITKTALASSNDFTIEFKGLRNTKGTMDVYWNSTKPIVKLDETPLVENVDWTWSNSVLTITYAHTGSMRTITVESPKP